MFNRERDVQPGEGCSTGRGMLNRERDVQPGEGMQGKNSFPTVEILGTHHPVGMAGVFSVGSYPASKSSIAIRTFFYRPFPVFRHTMLSYAQAFVALWYAQAVVAFFHKEPVRPMLTLHRADFTATYD